jgi:Restriction endonuclease
VGSGAPVAVARPRRAVLARHGLSVPLMVLVVAAVVLGALAVQLGRTGWRSEPAVDDLAVGTGALAAAGVLGLPATVRKERLRRSGIEAVDAMSGTEFEERLALLYAARGCRVVATGASGDFGADLVLERDGSRTVVQAKRYDRAVGIEAVQQVIGARRYYDADDASVVTNSRCTRAARMLAEVSAVELVEREQLIALLAAQSAEPPPGALVALARQLAEGAALAGFLVMCVLRALRWCGRSAWRALRPAR